MKVVAALGVLVLLLLVPPAVSQAPDDKLIVPGQRVGKWTLEMTINDLVQMSGSFSRAIPGAAEDLARSNLLHFWDELGFHAVTNTTDTQRIEVLGAVTATYRTDKGITVNVRRENVETAHGRPTAATQRAPGLMRLIYDEIGLGVTLLPRGVVDSVFIFRPGTAKQLWKF
jgi:hypothetical protein